MKRVLALLTLAFSVSAVATPIVIDDLYVGGNDHGDGDVIGHASMFGIDSMTVDLAGSILSVTINTPFGDTGLGTYGFATNTPLSNSKGIGFGDLFLSSTGWAPFGAAPYKNDDHSSGTIWDYGISLTDRWSKTSGSSLYALNAVAGNPDAYITDDFLSCCTFRNGQEVAVKTGQAGLLTNLTSFSSTTPGKIIFTVDIAGTGLATASSIGLHWGMSCGNDTIEGEYSVVPEPATLVLMLLGLLCIGFASMHRSQFANRSTIG